MNLERLIEIIPPPERPIDSGHRQDWKAVEEIIGIALPPDYKEFICTYGTGCIGNFLWIFNPYSKNRNLQLHLHLEDIHQADRELKATYGSVLPVPIFPRPDGVLPFGVTDNGDYLSWVVQEDCSTWPVLVSESRGPEWERFNLTMTDFRLEILEKRRVCGIFPEDFPPIKTTFIARD